MSYPTSPTRQPQGITIMVVISLFGKSVGPSGAFTVGEQSAVGVLRPSPDPVRRPAQRVEGNPPPVHREERTAAHPLLDRPSAGVGRSGVGIGSRSLERGRPDLHWNRESSEGSYCPPGRGTTHVRGDLWKGTALAVVRIG